MSILSKNTLNEKIEKLKQYYGNRQMKLYYDLGSGEKITPEEALKLYAFNKDIGIPKSTLYFLLSEDDKLKYIEDVGQFDELFNGCFFYTNNQTINHKVIERACDLNYVTASNLDNFLKLIDKNDIELIVKLVHSAVMKVINTHKYDELVEFTILNKLPETSTFKILKDAIKNLKSSSAIEYLTIYVENIKNDEQRIELICDLFKSEYFAHDIMQGNRETQGIFRWVLKNNDDRERLVEYIANNKESLNKCVSLEAAIASLPVENIKKYFESNLDMNYSMFVYSMKKEDWKELYNYFSSLGKEGEKYLNIDFITKGKKAGTEDEYEEIFIKNILNNSNLNLVEKYQAISNIFDEEELFYGLDVMFKTLGVEDTHEYLYQIIADFQDKYDMSKYPNLKKAVIHRYGIKNEENLDKFLEKFGNLGICGLENENVLEFVNLDSKSFDKIMNLFNENNTKLNMDVVNTIVNSLLQRQFKIDQSEDYNIFAKFERLLQDKNQYTISETATLLNNIGKIIDISSFETEHELIISDLFEHKKESIDLLHKITDAYIARKREMYIAKKMDVALDSLKADKYYNKAYIKKNFFLLNSEIDISAYLSGNRYNAEFDGEEIKLLDSPMFDELIHFKKAGGKPTPEIISQLKTLENMMNKMYDKKLLMLPYAPEDVKYEYSFPKLEDSILLDILSGINVKHIKESLVDKDELYNKLNSFLSKYKISGWGDVFEKLGNSADINIDVSTIYSLINYFDKIEVMFSQLPKKNQTLTALLDCANAYSSSSKKYQTLINKENLNYIITNPGPNQSSSSKAIRLGEISKHVKNMYTRDAITVPSGEKVLNLGENKKLKISIGDIYDPIALTYGERTGACLRIKGAFDDLFTYCLKDKNGFHIRFSDPETGEFVSRVSGIRNGNTVFLNELRNSVSESYSSEELVQALKEIAKFLVESTKDDPHPIENVVVSNDFAMENEEKYDLKIENVKTAFNGLNFNIHNKGNILYTSSEDSKELMPYKFGDEYVSEYRPYNTKVSIASKDNAKEVVNRVHMINELTKGVDLAEVQLLDVEDVEKCIYGNGWVVYIDSKKVVHEFVIDKFKDDMQLRSLIETNKEKYFGGNVRGENNR